MRHSGRLFDPGTATAGRFRRVLMLVVAAGLTLALSISGAQRAGADAADSAAVRGYIVPTPNNPDVNPATTCAAAFADNDQSDDQLQSPAGAADNAVTLAGCSYDAPPFWGPSTEDRPVVFQVLSGPGGLLCGPTLQQSQVCALPGINYGPGQEYRVAANNEAGTNASGTMNVRFCADDPPALGVCGPEDEETTQFAINWKEGAEGGQAGDPCQPPNCVPAGGTPSGAVGDRSFTAEVLIPNCRTKQITARVRIKKRKVRAKVVVKVMKIVFQLDRGEQEADRRAPYRKTFSLRNAAPGSLHTLRAKVFLKVKKGSGKAKKKTLKLSKKFRVCPLA